MCAGLLMRGRADDRYENAGERGRLRLGCERQPGLPNIADRMRQEDGEHGPASTGEDAAAKADLATVLFHDLSGDAKPQASTFAAFRGKERLEYFPAVFRANSRSIIGYNNAHASALGVPPVPPRCNVHINATAAPNGVDSVHHQVRKNLP